MKPEVLSACKQTRIAHFKINAAIQRDICTSSLIFARSAAGSARSADLPFINSWLFHQALTSCSDVQAAMAALVAFALKAGTMGPVDKATDKLDATRKKKLTDMMAEATASATSKPAAAAAGSAARPASIAVPAAAAAHDEPSSPLPGQAVTARVSVHILSNPRHTA